MWTATAREQHNRKAARYQSDLTDEKWRVIKPHLPEERGTGRPRGLVLEPLHCLLGARAAQAAPLEHSVMIEALFPFRALPDHARKTFQGHQRLAGIGPFLQFLDRDVIERLAAGAAGKKRARDVHHVRRTRALVGQRRAAMRAKAARAFCGFVLEAPDGGLALGDAKPLAPASDIGRVRRAMRAPARSRMIMPGP